MWITVPQESISEYGVYHFRKTLQLDAVPATYVVHISADNRYKLYVNEQLVSLGPSRGDQNNWNLTTLDLAPYLKAGRNILAAVVWYFADQAPVAQMDNGMAQFIMQGNTKAENAVNTDNSWKCIRNQAYSAVTDNRVMGYYAAGATDRIDMSRYPWGWERADFDDSGWKAARPLMMGLMKGSLLEGMMSARSGGAPLVPAPIPAMEMTPERLSDVRLAEGVKVPADFLKKPTEVVIPAHTKAKLLLDNRVLTTGYPTLLFSKGRGASIQMGYAEALYQKTLPGNTQRGERPKGNRNEVEGKEFVGYHDQIMADGGEQRSFTPLWWRTWRYIQLDIETADQPLVLNDLYATFSAYPFVKVAQFKAEGHPEYDQLLENGWRTARLCANETYMDCPYYEQLQYFGDTRIQTMITMYNTTDRYMVKQALDQGRQSMHPEGFTLSRYPDRLGQKITSYALSWIGMCYDYWMYRGESDYLKTLLPATRTVLAWYESFLKPDYSLKRIPYWYFCDWSAGFQMGEPIREDDGNSAIQDLNYLLALDEAAAMERQFGLPSMGDHYQQIAAGIRGGFKAKYWDEGRRLFADTHDHRNYSQHTNTLAILAGMVEGEQAKDLFTRMLNDTTLNQATIYFRYFVNLAMDKAGCADLLLDHIDTWTSQLPLGLSTCIEQPEPSRSDCHAWGASLNIEFLRMVLGVRSDAPAFDKVRIRPALGKLKTASGTIPHPKGDIRVAYALGNKLEARITLPLGLTGTLVWNGKEYPLHEGNQTLKL